MTHVTFLLLLLPLKKQDSKKHQCFQAQLSIMMSSQQSSQLAGWLGFSYDPCHFSTQLMQSKKFFLKSRVPIFKSNFRRIVCLMMIVALHTYTTHFSTAVAPSALRRLRSVWCPRVGRQSSSRSWSTTFLIRATVQYSV